MPILHYKENESPYKDGDVILIDAGRIRGYAADITRSWPNNGKFTDAQREIYQIVLDSQEAAIVNVFLKTIHTYHDAARRVLAKV